jgi:hypothetical protein
MLLKNNYNNYEKCTEAFTTYCNYTDDVLFREYNECTPKNGAPYAPTSTRPPIMSRAYAQIAFKNITFSPLSNLTNLINEEIIPGVNNLYIYIPVVCLIVILLFKLRK